MSDWISVVTIATDPLVGGFLIIAVGVLVSLGTQARTPDQATPSSRGNDHGTRRGDLLQSRCQIEHLADRRFLARTPFADHVG